MIENDTQAAMTEKWIEKFTESIVYAKNETIPEDIDSILWNAYIAGMQSQLDSLTSELNNYLIKHKE